MKKFRLVEYYAGAAREIRYTIELRTWWCPIWRDFDANRPGFSDLRQTQQEFISVVANRGPRKILAIQ
jgi:hypothetical protein